MDHHRAEAPLPALPPYEWAPKELNAFQRALALVGPLPFVVLAGVRGWRLVQRRRAVLQQVMQRGAGAGAGVPYDAIPLPPFPGGFGRRPRPMVGLTIIQTVCPLLFPGAFYARKCQRKAEERDAYERELWRRRAQASGGWPPN